MLQKGIYVHAREELNGINVESHPKWLVCQDRNGYLLAELAGTATPVIIDLANRSKIRSYMTAFIPICTCQSIRTRLPPPH